MEDKNWHNISWEKTVKILESDHVKGLNEKEVKKRRNEFGSNLLPKKKSLSKVRIFLAQFKSPLIYILVIAGVTTFLFERNTDAIVIFMAVFLNTIVGFIQENKASETLKELRKIINHEAEVLREGKLKMIDSSELVPGDIVILNSGNKVPADGRVIEANDLKINEMALTGEWLVAHKNPKSLDKDVSLADRDNMVYAGTVIENGKAKIIVIDIGQKTEIGKVAEMLEQTQEEETPYQKKLAHFSKIIGVLISLISLFILIQGLITGQDFVEMFSTAVAIAVASVPEGLPIAMTVILSLGMRRILKRKGLVRKLASAETLGSTSVICTDKTATLTEGKMKVSRVLGNKDLALRAGALTSESFLENPGAPRKKWIFRGRPTDKALLEAGIDMIGLDKNKNFEKNKLSELLFNPVNKYAAAVYKENNKKILYICGAPEKVLDICKLTKKQKDKLKKDLKNFTQKGFRVVASAYKETKIKDPIERIAQNLKFAGFILLEDPVRKDVKKAMEICRRAGMRPVIITGDHKLTAKAVAEELGFKIKEKNILEGKELDRMSDLELGKRIRTIQIYARVEPKHKMRIIEAWQEKGEVVAMTGDGINDAPALKKADIGIALGSGTEVAKEASDLILLNDSFSIIVAAIEEGRAILDNIRKVIVYLLADCLTEIMLIGVSIIARLPLPISAVQILWVNLVDDGPPGIALSFEPKEDDLMKRKPQGYNISLLNREMKTIIFIIGIITDLFVLGIFFWLLSNNYDILYIRTMIFSMLGLNSLFYAFSCKNLKKNIWNIDLFSNKLLIWACLFGIVIIISAVYFPPFQILLKTVPLTIGSWMIILVLGMTKFVFIEITKWYFIIKNYVY
jgi:P-type Ca2+ transporter type 2C